MGNKDSRLHFLVEVPTGVYTPNWYRFALQRHEFVPETFCAALDTELGPLAPWVTETKYWVRRAWVHFNITPTGLASMKEYAKPRGTARNPIRLWVNVERPPPKLETQTKTCKDTNLIPVPTVCFSR
jgi:hypothetical protein